MTNMKKLKKSCVSMAGRQPECVRDVSACTADLGVLHSRAAAPAYLSSAPDHWGQPQCDSCARLADMWEGELAMCEVT